jgi:histidinol phosphatase-like PHP family hydrolase
VPQVESRGKALGVHPTVSDHISRDAPTSLTSVVAIAAYLDDLEQHDVLRGGEFCWHDSLWRELPEHIVRRFTHRLGSLHSIRLSNGTFFRAFSAVLPDALTPQLYMEAHVTSLEALAREMPVDILAHPTLVPPPMRTIPAEELWSVEHEERAVQALLAGGQAFEISARYPPHERLVRRAADAGVRLSLGSDGHTLEQVANIAKPLAMARALGVKDDALYDPTRHGSRTGAFPR